MSHDSDEILCAWCRRPYASFTVHKGAYVCTRCWYAPCEIIKWRNDEELTDTQRRWARAMLYRWNITSVEEVEYNVQYDWIQAIAPVLTNGSRSMRSEEKTSELQSLAYL